MSLVLLAMITDVSYPTRSRLMGGLTASMLLLCRGTMDAQFPGDLSNRQSPALGLLNSVPPCRLKWSGLPALHCRCLADSDSAVVDGRVVSIAGVHLCIECCQGRLPAPAQTVETVMWGWPVRGRSVEASERAFGPWSASRPLAAVEGVEAREQ